MLEQAIAQIKWGFSLAEESCLLAIETTPDPGKQQFLETRMSAYLKNPQPLEQLGFLLGSLAYGDMVAQKHGLPRPYANL